MTVETPASPQAAPLTTRFQVLFGPNGLARIVLLADTDAENRPIATLDLNASDADLLARLLTTRREVQEQASRQQGESPRQ